MPGYDKSKIVGWNASDLDEFMCGICQDVLNKPVVTQCCRQSYCRDCIEEWLKGRSICPNDRQPLTMNGLSEVPRLVINFINKMRIKCDFSDNGCAELTTIGTKVNHVKICIYDKCKICCCCPKGNNHDCIAYLKQENSKLSSLLENSNKEKLDIEKNKSTIEADLKVVIKSRKWLTGENTKLVNKNKELAEKLKLIKLELDETKSVLKKRKFDAKEKMVIVSPQFVVISSAIMLAKNHQPNVDYNRNIFPLSKPLIEICNESINGFDLSTHDEDIFVESIFFKIQQKMFTQFEAWKVKALKVEAHVHSYCVTARSDGWVNDYYNYESDDDNDDDYDYDTHYKSILRLSYDKLIIKIFAYFKV